MNTRFRRFRRFRLGPGRAFLLRRNRAHNGRIAEILESQTRTGQICPVECEKPVKSRSFPLCFPRARSASRVLRTARARTVRTLLTERVRHRTPLSPLRRAVERHARTRAPHTAARVRRIPGQRIPPSHLQSRHAGRQQGGRGGAQARRGGSRDRGGPVHARTVPRNHRAPQRVRRTHGARARDARSSVRPPHPLESVFPTTAHRAARTRARRRARPERRIASRGEKSPRAASPVDARARGSPRVRRYNARADRASPHPPDRTVSPDPRLWSSPRRRPFTSD